MAIFAIDTPIDIPLWRQTVTLDGRDFILEFDYLERGERYYMSIFLPDDTPLVRGIKIVPNWPLTRRKVDRRLFPGELFAETSDNAKNLGPPEFGELGINQRCTLQYYDAEESDGLIDGSRRIGVPE